jgi:glucosamine kinase
MFIVVDSGSSKADWAIVTDDGKTNIITTSGINPSTQKDLLDLSKDAELSIAIQSCKHIFFYSAGMSTPESNSKTKEWLKSNGCVGHMETESDALGGARACFGDEPGILCILGTGSNASYYDGLSLKDAVPSLGYIISDEGGGVHLGKEILKSYIYGTMPTDVKKIFENHYGQISPSEIMKQLYKEHSGSAYLAKFAGVLTHVDNEWKDEILGHCFEEFIKVRLHFLKKKYDVSIKIIGSIGYLHREHLFRAAKNMGIDIVECVQKPILPLIEYHKNKIYE